MAMGDASSQDAVDPSETIQQVVVTGSRIIRDDASSPSPLTVLSEQDIRDAGTLSFAEVLRKDPALGSATRGPAYALNGGGAAGVNLRNLGGNRTLVLINGKRLSTFADEIQNVTMDISTIPSFLVSRIDVLRDGASTAYGADAVAGVVNFVFKDTQAGGEGEAYYAQSERGDGTGYRFSSSFGDSGERGSFVFGAQYQHQDPIMQSRREWGTDIITSLTGAGSINTPITPGGTVLGPDRRIIACYPMAGGATNLAPNCERYDASAQTSLTLGTTLKSFGGVAHYDLTDDVRLNITAFHSTRDSEQTISAAQLNTGTLTGPYTSGFVIPATNSNNPYGQPVTIQWRPAQYGGHVNYVNSKLLWATAGLSGTIFDRFNWEVSHTFSETRADSERTQIPNAVHFFRLLNPTECAADPTCSQAGAIPDIAGLLSQTSPLTQAQLDYLFFSSTAQTMFRTQQSVATLGGALFSLPAGEVQAVLGLEYRSEEGTTRPDPVSVSGESARSLIFPTDGRFNTREAFAEVDLPLAKGLPAIDTLELNLQGRYSEFSNFDEATTYKAGLNYSPLKDVRFRVSYGTSFRAPDIIELYGGGIGATGALTDPCNAGGLRAVNATVDANCDALGVPETFQQASVALPQRSGGNPGLEPEEGETKTYGIVLTPAALPGFSITADYYDIEIDDVVTAGGLTTFLPACYSDSNFLSRARNPLDTCFGFDLRPGATSELGRLNSPRLNLQKLSTSGVDATLDYSFDKLPLVPGALRVSLRGSWLESFVDGTGVERVGTFINGVVGDSAYPRWRGYFDLQYEVQDLAFRWSTNYTKSMQDSGFGTSVPINNFKNYSGTPDYYVHNVLVRWSAVEGVDVSLGINNVFDKDPPYAFVTTRNTLPAMFDQLGRYFFGSMSVKF
jgi:iron complex outermembrane receptor protein